MARLTIRQITDMELTVCREEGSLADWMQKLGELYTKIKVFEAAVWFPRLQQQVNSTDSRGMSGTCKNVKILTWCCAGRCLIQLEVDPSSHLQPKFISGQPASLTLVTADDEQPWQREMAHVAPSMGPMGLQSIDAEWLDAMIMLYTVTRWGDEINLVPNDSVTVDLGVR